MKPMTRRQAALLNYVETVYPQVKRARSLDEAMAIVMKCVREDSAFVLTGLAKGAVQIGQRVLTEKIEEKGMEAFGKLGKMAGAFISGLGKTK